MPNVICGWDVCEHCNETTGYCEYPGEIVLKNEDVVVEGKEEYFLTCRNFKNGGE